MSYIAAGLGITVVLLGLALGIAGKAYLSQRDENVMLVQAAAIARLTQQHKEDMEAAIAAITVSYDAEIAETERVYKDEVNGIMLQLASAQQDASQKPMAFGDDLIRDIVYVDCMWASGVEGTNREGRKACRDEAAFADPAKSGLPFTVLTPDFLTNWADACDDFYRVGVVVSAEADLSYTKETWVGEYGSFDPRICSETLVAFTPEGSLLLRNFINNGQNYSTRLLTYAVEQQRIIDILSQ